MGRSILEVETNGTLVEGRGHKCYFPPYKMAKAHQMSNFMARVKINGSWLLREEGIKGRSNLVLWKPII